MDITAERQGSAVVLSLDGSLTVETDTYRLHELAESLSRTDASGLVLDLGNVCRLDSFGVGQLVAIYKEVRVRGLALTLVNVERHQKRLLEVAGLLGVFPIFESRLEALRWCGDPLAPLPGRPPARSCEASRDAA